MRCATLRPRSCLEPLGKPLGQHPGDPPARPGEVSPVKAGRLGQRVQGLGARRQCHEIAEDRPVARGPAMFRATKEPELPRYPRLTLGWQTRLCGRRWLGLCQEGNRGRRLSSCLRAWPEPRQCAAGTPATRCPPEQSYEGYVSLGSLPETARYALLQVVSDLIEPLSVSRRTGPSLCERRRQEIWSQTASAQLELQRLATRTSGSLQ